MFKHRVIQITAEPLVPFGPSQGLFPFKEPINPASLLVEPSSEVLVPLEVKTKLCS